MSKNLTIFATFKHRNCITTRSSSRFFVTKVAHQTQLNTENLNKNEWESAKPYESIPGPGKWSLLRSFLPGGKFHNKSRVYISETLHHKYGEIVKIPGMFKEKDVIFTFNANYFEKTYRHDGVWPSRIGLQTLTYYRHNLRPEIFEETGTLLTNNGEQWGKLRSIVNPIMMQPKTIKTYVSRMDKTTTKFIERIRKIRNPNTLLLPDNFEFELNTLALEHICLVGLDSELGLIGNEDKNSDGQKLIRSISTIFSLLGEIEFKPSLWKYYETPNYKKIIEAYDALTEITLKYIDEAIERYKTIEKHDNRNEQEKSIVQRLININKNVAVVMAIEMFFAGVDTTTSVFAGLMLALSKNPEKQEILREEVNKLLPSPDTPITEEKLKNLPYLRAFIKESIRKYPVVHEHLRTTTVNFVLGGYQIPKNTDIIMHHSHLYHDKNYFSEPDKFIPERWLRNNEQFNITASKCPVGASKPSNPFVFLPFGVGNRMCVGKRLVDMEVEILLARLVNNFHVEYNYDDKDIFELKLVYMPVKPLNFKLTDINN
ncbi:cytochrome P450 CYP12A2-like [Condylostylus longicornis]|uniref:cytochrome P450 CYP12A2-like n=1 Tax=Condylostylus longicornis TaxID=2530218 RepID=UPI00244E5BA5|nr:cytochrome P450 CYP12A2-like [Condylostylus longicornis]